jgi:hypothetical protein
VPENNWRRQFAQRVAGRAFDSYRWPDHAHAVRVHNGDALKEKKKKKKKKKKDVEAIKLQRRRTRALFYQHHFFSLFFVESICRMLELHSIYLAAVIVAFALIRRRRRFVMTHSNTPTTK